MVLILDVNVRWDEDDDPSDPVPYAQFPWTFDVHEWRDPEWASKALNTIRRLFDGLVATGRYNCMLIQLESEEVLSSNYPGYEKS